MNTPGWIDEKREKPPTKANFDFVPHLPLAERQRRWTALRQKMVLRGLNCLIFYGNDAGGGMGMANFRYITHIASRSGGWAVFPLEGEPVVFNTLPHQNIPYSIYRSLQDWVQDIRPNTGVSTVIDYIKQRGLERGRIGIVDYGSALAPPTIPYYNYVNLTAGLPNATITRETALVEEMRIIKSSEEITFLEKASEIARKKIDAMIEAAHPGATEAEVWARMAASDVINGGEPETFNMLTSDNVFEEDEGFKHLLHGVEVPGTPTMRPIRNGDLIITEFHACYGGYRAASEFSVFVGKPPQALFEIHQACVESLEAAEKTMKPGTSLHLVWEAMREPVERRKFDFVELGFHGHGLTSPEYPTATYRPGNYALSGNSIGDLPLQENMVLGINIDVHNPNWRKDIGIMLGDMIHVTSHGSRCLVQIPKDFTCTIAG